MVGAGVLIECLKIRESNPCSRWGEGHVLLCIRSSASSSAQICSTTGTPSTTSGTAMLASSALGFPRLA